MQTLKRITNPDKNGFILLDNILGVMRYAMHSPLFRGARIRNCFGKVILDTYVSKIMPLLVIRMMPA